MGGLIRWRITHSRVRINPQQNHPLYMMSTVGGFLYAQETMFSALRVEQGKILSPLMFVTTMSLFLVVTKQDVDPSACALMFTVTIMALSDKASNSLHTVTITSDLDARLPTEDSTSSLDVMVANPILSSP